MKRTVFSVLLFSALFLLCTSLQVYAFQIITKKMFEEEMVTETDLIRTVDNFVVLFDTSSSTNQMVSGKNISKILATKNLLKERNAWLPELGYQAGLYIYTNDETLAGTFKEVYGMKTYDRAAFAAAIDQLPEKGRGPAMLQAGLHGLRKLLAGLTGKTAVIVFTDGTFTVRKGGKKPLKIAQELAKDNDVCFYLINSSDTYTEKLLLENVAKINACSRVVPLDSFLDNPQYIGGALFTTRTTSYSRLKPVTKVVGAVAEDVLFAFNSSVLESEYKTTLDRIGQYLQNNPDAYMVSSGYADSVGDEEYNMWLSERRAASVKSYIVDQFGIDEDRVVDLWFGVVNPVGDNATAAGRRLNRRVEIAIGGIN